jgi:hypothetical protein
MPGSALYGYKTNNSAKELIIDLFNEINRGKTYKMKTITTIYKNDEIFKDNLRYPIDAPYRSFYKELTETYVGKYGLDNIFFEKGIAKKGEYYFEYAYINKRFIVYSSPDEIDLNIRRRYVPMLYSMISGKRINWEEAQVEFVQYEKGKFNPNTSEKILLVFGKDKLKTLEFSWVASFQFFNVSKKEVISLTNDIRKQENIIINLTQGVLFTELDEIIVGFERIKELVKNHKHTIKNFDFDGHLMMLRSKLESGKIKAAFRILEYTEDLAFLRDASTDIIYNFYDKNTDLLLFRKQYNTYTKLLSLLINSYIVPPSKKFIFSKEIENDFLNRIDADDLIDVFTILINIYSNICSKDEFLIKISKNQHRIEILFENTDNIEDEHIDYLLGRTSVNSSKGEGLRFIVKSLEKLPHIKFFIKNIRNRTISTLLITKKE